MKPAPFAYRRPESLDEAVALVAESPDETSLLAGGQSLVPLMNLRLARPAVLVDLNRVEGLDGIEWGDGVLRLGAMVRLRRLETDELISARLPLLREATRLIAHVAIRTRGTIGGSLAHADPAAELPCVFAALGGRVLVRSVRGERAIPLGEFFLGPLTTARAADELVVAVELELPPTGTGWCFEEVARVHGAFALVAATALVGLGDANRLTFARLALGGVGGSPYLASWLEEAGRGREAGTELFEDIAERVRDEVEPFGDGHAGPDYRRRVARTLTVRALATAAARAERRP